MTFVRRKIELEFKLGKGAFGEDGEPSRVIVRDHRVQCVVHNVFGPGMGDARLRVFGLRPSVLNELASLNQDTAAQRQNRVIVRAGDEGAALATVFEGQISLSQLDMNSAPNVSLNIIAFGGLLEAVKTTDATSYPGSADAATILFNLAQRAGLFFDNSSGASRILWTPYFEGSYRKQIADCARAAGFGWVIDGGTLAIWPAGGFRRGPPVLISPQTGLVGYPGYSTSSTGAGISVRTIFNPQIRLAQQVQVESALKVANGLWTALDIQHELDAEMPGGQWFTSFNATPYGI